MTDEKIKALAKQLTEHAAIHSISLALPPGGFMHTAAQDFFATRDIFGIKGWASEEDAEKAIRNTLQG